MFFKYKSNNIFIATNCKNQNNKLSAANDYNLKDESKAILLQINLFTYINILNYIYIFSPSSFLCSSNTTLLIEKKNVNLLLLKRLVRAMRLVHINSIVTYRSVSETRMPKVTFVHHWSRSYRFQKPVVSYNLNFFTTYVLTSI